MRRLAFSLLALAVTLTGCSLTSTGNPTTADPVLAGAAMHGTVMGGQQPVVNAHVYLFAAATNGYAAASTSLLTTAQTGLADSIGAFVLTNAKGGWTLPAGYSCTAGTQTYLYALGGNPGSGVNSAAGFLALLGDCPAAGNLDAIPSVVINEASTVAAAFVTAGFAADATHIGSSGTTQGKLGIANAFALTANLESIGSSLGGLAVTPNGNGSGTQAKLNTLANILAACVNSSGPTSTNCTTLLGNAKSGSLTPTNTANAAIYIAQNPTANVAALYTLNNSTPPFANSLPAAPADWTLTLTYSALNLATPNSLAVDAAGNVTVANLSGQTVQRISPLGHLTSTMTDAVYFNQAAGVAFDSASDIYLSLAGSPYISELTTNDSVIRGEIGSVPNPYALIAIDGNGKWWSASSTSSSAI